MCFGVALIRRSPEGTEVEENFAGAALQIVLRVVERLIQIMNIFLYRSTANILHYSEEVFLAFLLVVMNHCAIKNWIVSRL